MHASHSTIKSPSDKDKQQNSNPTPDKYRANTEISAINFFIVYLDEIML